MQLNAMSGGLSAPKPSPTKAAKAIAGRLQRLGFEPFQSDRERYLVRLDDHSGEIVELGRPLRTSRLFKKSVLPRDIETVRNIEAFVKESGYDDLLYWGVGLTGAKADVGGLVEANVEFNRLINIHFSEMRRRNRFELILLVIHPRFDPVSRRFDLHAHFICRVPREHREAASRRLLTAFSKAHVPQEPVRKVAACATYMLWGICPPEETVLLPDEALSDLWRLSQSKARLVRKGRLFGKWTRQDVVTIDEHERERRERIKKNRLETADPRPQPAWRDRLLARVKATINGSKISALLFEERRGMSEDGAKEESRSRVDSSSATVATIQDSADGTIFDAAETIDVPETDAPAKAPERAKDGGQWDGARKLVRAATAIVARALRVSTMRLGEFARRLSCRCRGSPG
ncbi:hypothetical protein FLL57_20375 [Rhodopseudomonas palustris]|uniref:hypothetical protein n=1 Tax=Rhodopseudomonas palustris TaxID=1076 RepID=UPI00115E3866|nr:hypothetical protein [Rhodopseudomonas palustris]QDL99522.1 hypothetical protein FLL57_20375 [Rhodopseudomonas palustris]